MTWFLPESRDPGIPTATGPSAPPTPADVAGAAWTAETIESDAWNRTRKMRAQVLAEVQERLIREAGPQPDLTARVPNNPMLAAISSPKSISLRHPDFRAAVLLERAKAQATLQPGHWADLPTDADALEAETTRRLKAEHDEALRVLGMGEWGAGLTEFATRTARSATDEVGLLTLPLGGPVTGRLWKTVAAEAALGAFSEAVVLPRRIEQAERLDLAPPDVLAELRDAAIGSAALAAGLGGAARLWAYARTRTQVARDTRPAEADAIDHEADVDAAEAALNEDRPAPPTATSDTAAVETVLDRIIRVESGGRADAQNPNSSATGPAQFIESTWLDLIERHRPDLMKGRNRAMVLGLRTDPVLAREMLRSFTAENAATLRGAGLTPDPGALYLAHFAGPGTAVRVLKAAPDTPIAELLAPAQIKANAGIKAGGTSFAKFTAAHLRAWAEAKMAGVDAPAAPAPPPRTRAAMTAPEEVVSPGGIRVRVAYEVVDLDSLTAASGALQPRDRTRLSSDEQIAAIAAKLDPARLMPGPEADRGAPVVGPDNIVESGNGRVASLRRAADLHPDRYAAYVETVRQSGFEIPEGMSRPVLIARRQTGMNEPARVAWVNDNNTSAVLRMSATEQARADAALIDAPLMARYAQGKDVHRADNEAFVTGFLDRLPQAEAGGLRTTKGRLNVDGARRVRNALFHRAYGAPDMLARIAEVDDPEFRSLANALSDAAPAWAALRADIAAGRVRPEMDVSAQMLEAVRLIADARETARESGVSVRNAIREALDQIDMFTGAVNPLTEAFVRVFYRETPAGPRARAQADVAELLNAYVAEAQRGGSTTPGLLDTSPASPQDALDAVITRKDDPRYVRPDDGAVPGDAPGGGADRGPGSDGSGGEAGTAGDGPGLSFDEGPRLDPALTRAGAHAPAIIAADDAILDDLRRAFEAAKREPDRAAALEQVDLRLAELKAAQPADTLDDLFALAPQAQADLVAALRRAADPLGIGIKDPGLKRRSGDDSAETKMTRKGYATAREMTDIVRAGFAVPRADEADKVLAALRADFEVLDEGWSINESGFVDRKLIVRTSSGLLAEVQVWPAEMARAKFYEGGQALYTQRRNLPDGPEKQALMTQETAVYTAALPQMDPSFTAALGSAKLPNLDPKMPRNSASPDSILPVSPTSSLSTTTQSEPGLSSATAVRESSITAGRQSQFTNRISDPPVSDTSTLAPSRLKINEGPADGDFPVEFDAEGNPTRMASDILADLEADAEFAETLQFCAPTRGITDAQPL